MVPRLGPRVYALYLLVLPVDGLDVREPFSAACHLPLSTLSDPDYPGSCGKGPWRHTREKSPDITTDLQEAR